MPGAEELAGLTFIVVLNRSGATVPEFNPVCSCAAGLEPGFGATPSFGGSGLFRGSVRVVVEDEGVATGD